MHPTDVQSRSQPSESAATNLRTTFRAAPAHLITAAASLLATGVVAIVNPNETHVPLCPLHELTGLWCPFCGGLRAVFSLTRADPAAALRDNVLVVVLLPVVVALWADAVRRRVRARPPRRWPAGVTVAAIVGAVLFAVVRNLPPFAVLRP